MSPDDPQVKVAPAPSTTDAPTPPEGKAATPKSTPDCPVCSRFLTDVFCRYCGYSTQQ